ncbi:hypothetical protein AADR41_34795 [Streptomyces sp. CLV115]|uniref:hypothetical protein n=1 Tax=Streptomyces sp. CLV115 TaxID=3138502 RepID=UPI00313EE407
MDEVVPLLIMALAVGMGLFTWLAALARRRGAAGSALSAAPASYHEAYQGTAHQASHEIRAGGAPGAGPLAGRRMAAAGT